MERDRKKEERRGAMKLNLHFSHMGEKRNCTPLKKVRNGGVGVSGVVGGVHIVYM